MLRAKDVIDALPACASKDFRYSDSEDEGGDEGPSNTLPNWIYSSDFHARDASREITEQYVKASLLLMTLPKI